MRLMPASFSKKAVIVVVAAVFLVASNAWAALQTVRILGTEQEYQQTVEFLTNRVDNLEQLLGVVDDDSQQQISTRAREISRLLQTETQDAQLDPSVELLDSDSEIRVVYPSLLTALTIRPPESNSGLTLAQLTNTSGNQKVLTVDENGFVKLVDNVSPGSVSFPTADSGNPLFYDGDDWVAADDLQFTSGRIGIGKEPGRALDVEGSGAFSHKLTITSSQDDHLLELFPSGETGFLSSSGGALFINNTENTGTGIGIFSDAGAEALGNMINVKVDNPLYNQAAFYMNYDGLSNAVEIVSNTNDESSNALSVTNFNQLDSAVGVIGYETGRGTVKITHRRNGPSDANASGLSIDLQGTGTAAQGVYVDSTVAGGTTGNLLRLRNQTIDRFVVNNLGSVAIGGNGTNTSITKHGNTVGDEFFVGTNGAFRIQRSATDSEAFRTQIVGDTQGRWLGTSDGKLKWGDGSTAQDVVLQRGGANHLQLDDARLEIISNTTNTDVFTMTASDGSRLGRFVETSGGHGWFEVDDSSGTATVLLRADGGDSYFRTGQLGVGTTTPDFDLEVESNDASTYVANFFNDGNDANRYGIRIQAGADDASGTTYYLDAYDGDGGQVGYIANTDGTFAITDVSDVRTKTNIQDTELTGLDIINNLRVVDFNRLANPTGSTIHGFIAQEVEQVFPAAVTVSSLGLLGIQKTSLIPVLTKAIQEQQAQLNQLGELVASGQEVDPAAEDSHQPVLTADQADSLLAQSDQYNQHLTVTDQVWSFLREVVFQAKATFNQSVKFLAQVTFKDKIKVNQDTAGVVEIPAGSVGVKLSFSSPFPQTPVVQLTPQASVLGAYSVQDVTPTGFAVKFDQPQDQPIKFNWLAVMSENINGGQVEVLPDSQAQPVEQPTPTQSPIPSATPSPTPSPSPDASPDPSPAAATESASEI